MPKINQLPFEVANLIAAGEVVDRPASVVKELLENAIDAGATSVNIEIRRGGTASISIADNGCGMTPDDLPVCIRRHATSKIKTAQDLDGIATLGFRGEALAAIAAVCTLHIITKTKEAEIGTMLCAEGGKITEICEVGCADGTTVTVEDLFGNVPARRKFLKRDATETQAVAAVVEKVAMSRPDIAFRFSADGTLRFSTTGDGDLMHALYAVQGRDFASRLIKIDGALGDIKLHGYVGRPDNAKSNRAYQNFFLNGRYVHSKTVAAAVERAYTSYMAPEKFPVYALFMSLPYTAVDVNVHPAKLEVKFADERAVFEAVYYAVRGALEQSTARPAFADPSHQDRTRALTQSFAPTGKGEQIKMPPLLRPQQQANETPAPKAPEQPVLTTTRTVAPPQTAPTAAPPQKPTLTPQASLGVLQAASSAYQGEPTAFSAPQAQTPTAMPEAKEPMTEQVGLPAYRIVGVLFKCYIMVELDGDEALIIDQHAAHERILFEKLKATRKQDDRHLSQQLLVPLTASMPPEMLAVAAEHKDTFVSLGFDYHVGEKEVLISAIPDAVSPAAATDLLIQMCEEVQNGAGDPSVTEAARREKMLYQIACKAAIKGGREYDGAHIDWLVKELLRLPDITVCPHGRPVALRIAKSDLDRRFDRIK